MMIIKHEKSKVLFFSLKQLKLYILISVVQILHFRALFSPLCHNLLLLTPVSLPVNIVSICTVNTNLFTQK